MSKRIFCFAPSALLLALCVPAEAQQPGKIPRIGFLFNGSASDSVTMLRHDAFWRGLHDLGYLEGKNINIEYRYADGKLERLPELGQELVRLKVDLIVTTHAAVAQALKKSSTTIPVVMVFAGDPFGSRLVASLARPGGNVTGLYLYSPELVGKRLELLKEVLPKITRFAFLNGTDAPAAKSMFFKEAQGVAKALGVQFQLIEVK